MELRQQISEAVQAVRKHSDLSPEIALILGTGLGSLADNIDVTCKIDFADIPHCPVSTVESHAGELLLGHLAGKTVVALSGRFHYYEGYTLQQVTFPVRLARALGAETLIVSNAAGGMNPQFKAGDLMLITDHINFIGDNPLIGPNDDTLGPRFPDMCEPYTGDLIDLCETISLDQGIKLQRGVYLACTGPCLETRAEYRFMRMIGADAVGMSTVPEVIVAVHAGLKVLGISVITDECLPDALEPADVAKIIQTATEAEPRLSELLMKTIEAMA